MPSAKRIQQYSHNFVWLRKKKQLWSYLFSFKVKVTWLISYAANSTRQFHYSHICNLKLADSIHSTWELGATSDNTRQARSQYFYASKVKAHQKIKAYCLSHLW